MKAKKMDIQLKHLEIEKAVRLYVSEKIGINLAGKRLNVAFSMGRGPQALVANLSIEDTTDTTIPGYTDRDADEVKTAPVVGTIGAAIAGVIGTTATSEDKPEDVIETETSVPQESFDAAPVTEAAEAKNETAPVEEETKTTTSLFGN